MADFIAMTCKSCGGKLQITPEIEDFACVYCGNEFIVNRGDGIVSLTPIAENIKGIHESADKTASELAIIRLRKELTDLFKDRKEIEKELNRRDKKKEDDRRIIQRTINKETIIISISIFVLFLFCSFAITDYLDFNFSLAILAGLIISIPISILFVVRPRETLREKKIRNYDKKSAEIDKEYADRLILLEQSIKEMEQELKQHKNNVSSNVELVTLGEKT